MKIFYHSSDYDGECSAAIAKLKYPKAKIIPANYNKRVFLENIEQMEPVFVLDFTFPPEDMQKLNAKADLVWIDHHKTAIEMVDNSIKGVRDVTKAACVLTWEYLFPGQEPPVAVTYLGKYDIWIHDDLNVLYFQYGLRARKTFPSRYFNFWKKLLTSDQDSKLIRDILKEGEIIYRYIKLDNQKYLSTHGFLTNFEGYKVLLVNRGNSNSLLFDGCDKQLFDLAGTFSWSRINGDYKWRITLYSNKIDVSKIAEKYGGGGHANAAAFTLDTEHFNEIIKNKLDFQISFS